MKHTGILSGIVLATFAVVGSAGLAMGPQGVSPVTFQELDADGNGELSKTEMGAYRTTRFNKADSDGDEKLSLEEMQVVAVERAKERSKLMFERQDTNKDGFLTSDEMPKPRKESRFFDRVDSDDSGSISEQEFADMGSRMGSHGKKHRQGCKIQD